jgi:hypothetical protein
LRKSRIDVALIAFLLRDDTGASPLIDGKTIAGKDRSTRRSVSEREGAKGGLRSVARALQAAARWAHERGHQARALTDQSTSFWHRFFIGLIDAPSDAPIPRLAAITASDRRRPARASCRNCHP